MILTACGFITAAVAVYMLLHPRVKRVVVVVCDVCMAVLWLFVLMLAPFWIAVQNEAMEEIRDFTIVAHGLEDSADELRTGYRRSLDESKHFLESCLIILGFVALVGVFLFSRNALQTWKDVARWVSFFHLFVVSFYCLLVHLAVVDRWLSIALELEHSAESFYIGNATIYTVKNPEWKRAGI